MRASGEDQQQQTKRSLEADILTVREVAAYLRLTEATVCNLVTS